MIAITIAEEAQRVLRVIGPDGRMGLVLPRKTQPRTGMLRTFKGGPLGRLVGWDKARRQALVDVRIAVKSTSNITKAQRFLTAGANGTSALWAMQIGTTTRYTSGGTDLTVSNPNTESSATLTSVLTAKAGPIVIAAENATSRRIGHGVLRDGIEVAGDSKLFVFGGDPIQSTVEAASGTFDAINAPPVVLGSGGEFMLGLAGVAQSVAGIYGVSGGGYWR